MGKKIKLVRKTTILEILGVSERQLLNLEKDGIAEKHGDGYKVVETIKNYVAMSKKRTGGTGKNTVSLADLSEILGIAERTTRELAMKGVLKKTGDGVYVLKDSIQGYINHKFGDEKESKNEVLLKKKADREIKEIDLLEKKSQLVKKDHVKEFLGNMLINFKNTLLAYPGRLAAEKIIEAWLKDRIEKDLKEILEEWAADEYE